MAMEIVIAVVSLVLLVAVFTVLALQPHPEDKPKELQPVDAGGPTEAPYPPGSRPAGPGAENDNPARL